MTDREKLVKETEKALEEIAECGYVDDIKVEELAKKLVDLRICKVTDDMIVLSRDKYNELRSRPNDCIYIDISENYVKECQKEIKDAVEKAHKEATSEFAKEYIDWLKGNTVRNPMQAFEEFIKEKGVAVE